MSAESDLLRRAATLARDTANNATNGPWRNHDTHLNTGGHTATVMTDRKDLNDTRLVAWLPSWSHQPWDETHNPWNTARHIALWTPGVALAVADWLEQYAADELHEEMPPNERAASGQGCQWCADEDWPCADRRAALAVARALLNEEPTHE